MKRRSFLAGAAGGLGAAVVTSSARAQGSPEIKWRMATGWPKSLDTIYGSAEDMCKRIGELTDGKFIVQPFAGGEIVPALQVFDSVSAGTVECGHTLTAYSIGKDPVFAFDSGVAFGANARQQAAWLYYGGGQDVLRPAFAKYNLLNLPCGNVGVQMGGWYRKEIKTVEDINGLRIRIGGLGGFVLRRLGAVPQQIAPGDIYSSLERGVIDAAEWIGPYDDEKLGFAKVAKYYYTPGWWEGSAMITSLVNTKAWAELPERYRKAYECAANEQNLLMPARYDVKNPDALKRLIGGGTELRAFPAPVLEACLKATKETFAEMEEKSEDFKRVYDHWKRFMNASNEWFSVAEFRLDAIRLNSAKW